MSRDRRSSAGFSIIEVLAALVILCTAVAAVIGIFSTSLKGIRKAEEHALAVAHARSLLEEALALEDVMDAAVSLELEGGYTAEREITEIETDERGALYEIRVTVKWPDTDTGVVMKSLRAVGDVE